MPDKEDFQVPLTANPQKTWLVSFISLILLSIAVRRLRTHCFRSTGLYQPFSELVNEQLHSRSFREHGVMTSDLKETK